ncbi:MAG: heparinase II/III-family protein, partial [Alphaproteobacteria bacterium]|nr:heparinase II/III-family protein [Alphaproteobacteria bacterium]
PQDFAVRFHLHPSVKASLAENGTQALLRLPGGEGWRLRSGGGRLEIADSVYLGDGQPRRGEQIVLAGTATPDGAQVKWAFQRIPRRAE